MKFTTAAVALLFTGLVAAIPNEPPKKPSKPTQTNVNQQNFCGNNAQPYCCFSDNKGGYSSCYAITGSSQCSQTTVCCNANNSIQSCIGNAVIN